MALVGTSGAVSQTSDTANLGKKDVVSMEIVSRLEQFRQGLSYLNSGKAWQEGERFEAAIRDFRNGLEVIGEEYASPEVIDDTSMKFMLSQTQIRDRQYEQAAAVLERVLETRLNLFAKKYNISN
jgi:hypothetical protein